MTNQSTRKIFDMMGIKANKASSVIADETDDAEVFSAPQLQPAAEMEHILANILGSTATKKHSPMD